MSALTRRALCGTAAVAWAGSAFGADRLKIAVGQQGAWETSIVDLAQRGGFFQKRGIDAEILYTQGGGETLQVVISGSADIGVGVGMVGVLGAFSKGAPVRIIGAETTGPADFWYVKAGSPIKQLKDYKQPVVVAFSTIGGSTHTGILRLAKTFGLDVKPVATGGPQATLTQVLSGQVEVGWSTPPLAVDRIDRGELRVVGSLRDIPAVRDQTVRVNAANARALARQPELFARWAQAYRDALNWLYHDPAGVAAYVQYSGYPLDVAKRARDEFFPQAMLDPDKMSGIPASQEDAVDFKVIGKPLTDEQLKQLIQIPAPL